MDEVRYFLVQEHTKSDRLDNFEKLVAGLKEVTPIIRVEKENDYKAHISYTNSNHTAVLELMPQQNESSQEREIAHQLFQELHGKIKVHSLLLKMQFKSLSNILFNS